MDETKCYFLTDKLIVNQLSMVELEKENFDKLFPFETFNMTYDWKSIPIIPTKLFGNHLHLGTPLKQK